MPVKYLVDACVVIAAFDDYYPPTRIPQFWSWLVKQGLSGTIKIPTETFDEIMSQDDDLVSWVESPMVRDALILQEDLRPEVVNKVLKAGYHLVEPDADAKRDIGKDHNLIAYALADKANRVVVTNEVSKPGRQGKNRQIPDVCGDLGVECINDFVLYRRLDFNTRPEK